MWFEELMGFREENPEQVRERLELNGTTLRSRVNGARVDCGRLEIPSLALLRRLDRDGSGGGGAVREVIGEVGAMHRDAANAGALFQAASQFNLLEMVSPNVTPEKGVGCYSYDKTQGPVCAMACGGGTIYRNYYVELDGQLGQSAHRQIDCLADLGAELGEALWDMRNGYALAHEEGLSFINARLRAADEAELERLRGLLRVGVQHDVGVLGTRHAVTQVYGSALPVGYCSHAPELWEPFARLVLEASYEATLRAARIWQTGPVFLTLLGGGVFGNDFQWIEDAIVRAIERVPDLDVRIVSYNKPHPATASIIRRCGAVMFAGAGGRTSRASPLKVGWVEAPGGPPVGVTFAPGKIQPGAISGPWRRSLELDLAELRHEHQVDDLVCLVEDHELHSLNIAALPQRAEAHGISFHRLPVRDGDVPSPEAMRHLQRRVAQWRAEGRRVAFHCKGGLGRAGTAASCALVAQGVEPREAISRVRQKRHGAVENRAQERFIQSFG